MKWQLYWPAWWHLYPYYACFDWDIAQYKFRERVFCFGAFQIRWVRLRK